MSICEVSPRYPPFYVFLLEHLVLSCKARGSKLRLYLDTETLRGTEKFSGDREDALVTCEEDDNDTEKKEI